MNWIRISTQIAGDPKVHAVAESLRIPVPHAVGLIVGTLVQLPTHAKDGNLAGITDSLLEQWAGWAGKPRGGFSRAFRTQFCDASGVVTAWMRHNGAAIRDAERSARNAKAYRERQRNRTGDVSGDATGDVTAYETRRDGTEQNSSSTAAKPMRGALFLQHTPRGAA